MVFPSSSLGPSPTPAWRRERDTRVARREMTHQDGTKAPNTHGFECSMESAGVRFVYDFVSKMERFFNVSMFSSFRL